VRRTWSRIPLTAFTASLQRWRIKRSTAAKTADTIRVYRGKQLLKTIRRPLRDSNPFQLSHVTWLVPRTLRGRLRFSVRLADAAGNESNLGWAFLSIH